ncbi:carboxylesterase family protein [Streptomyces olivoreticuli]|uniref:carboxylesterase/lipase family protein n=1 Tax=Streptomyces olivoreticuli TaxID=68246 RepID=UPI00265803EE|nr:carboxylesterase family protein [Streptomyces olivoreticuli]WKK24088.1 carboxylesterase family protein [Streptomyces olivoreticuli]
MSDPVVHIGSGAVRGRRAAGLSVFKGIPYARPPFGPHRFRAPVEAEPWEGIREAAEFGSRAPQVPIFPWDLPWTADEGLDCLTVNVWTPDPGGAGLPVMVWIHGGGYQFGSAGEPDYDASLLAAAGVVAVTCNYRLGLDGFAHVAGAPPNRGLLDQAAALRWVQDNIAAFGGDPGRVTIFGESAGGGSVACLMAMPSAHGLFRRAIVQSAPRHVLSEGLAGRIAAALAHRLGTDPTVEGFSSRGIEDVLEEAGRLITEDPVGRQLDLQLGRIAFGPVVDGQVLPRAPWDAPTAGTGSDVELIAGFNADEYRLFAIVLGTTRDMSDEELSHVARTLAPANAQDVCRQSMPGTTARDRDIRLLSDAMFRMPTARLADTHQAGGGTTYAYELTWPAPGSDGTLGACHALDVPLTFGTFGAPLAAQLIGESPQARAAAEELSRSIRTSWTAFASTGDPGWPRYDATTATTRVYNTEITDVNDPEATSRRLWADHPFAPLL